MGNEFWEGGLRSFRKTGLSQEERHVAKEELYSFEEQREKLRMGAETVIKNHQFTELVHELLKRNGYIPENLTEDVCTTFLEQHPDIAYEPAMVRTVADLIVKNREGLH